VAYAQSEDELAGVIAHEVGHVLARHIAIDLTSQFRRSLNVTGFGDRADIEAKYRQLVDAKRRERRSRRREHRQQLEADLVALVAVGRAGYSPAAYVDLWDRYTEIEGRTGNFFSDLFGTTRPESKRLREMLRTMTAIPADCRPSSAVGTGFADWQRRVVAYDGSEAATALTAAPSAIVTLTPPLRPDITHLKFSPDGRWALARDTAGISVLARAPFELRFRIPIDLVESAQFSHDSREILVHTASQRIERWSVEHGQRVDVLEMSGKHRCLESKLSPDGRILGCLTGTFRFDVLLIDVATGEVRYRKSGAYTLDFDALRRVLRDPNADWSVDVFQLEFSPDGRYFIVGNAAGETVVDVTSHAEAKLPDRMKRAFRNSFAFLGSDRVATVDPINADKSTVVSYPDGAHLRHVTLGGKVTAATRGEFVVLRPIQEWAVGLVDLTANRIVLASRSDAFDAYETLHLTERPNGDIGLYQLGTKEPVAVATLPHSALGPIRVFDVSPDLRFLALSGRDRGGVWDLTTGERLAHVRGFNGAYLATDGGLYADVPERRLLDDGKVVTVPRTIVRVDLRAKSTVDIATLDETAGMMSGRYLISRSRTSKNPVNRDFRFDVRDVVSNQVVWSRVFDRDIPLGLHVDRTTGRLAIEWSARSAPAREAMSGDAVLQERGRELEGGDAFVEVIDLASGAPVGRLFIDTNDDEGKVRSITSTGSTVVVGDADNQLMVYSLSTGDRIGSVFGTVGLVSERTGVLCVQNDRRVLDVYDLKSLERLNRVPLPATLRLIRFDSSGQRLMALTTDQRVYLFDVAAVAAASR
jgi:WD40 repeat protein